MFRQSVLQADISIIRSKCVDSYAHSMSRVLVWLLA